MSNKRLGRGLEALIRPQDEMVILSKPGITKISIDSILPNPHQPRQEFDENALEELTLSIKEKGILTPITIKLSNDQFILVAGERRVRASKMAGLKEIPAYIVDVEDEAEMMEMSLVENIQRENLNPIEEAEAYAFLNSKFDLSQEKIAKAVGKKRVTVANALRLLNLPKEIKDSIRKGTVSAGHGRAILMMKTTAAMRKLHKKIIDQGISVRAAETYAKESVTRKISLESKLQQRKISPQLQVLENELISILGTKVKINAGKDNGTITISYFSEDDLERILDLLRSI